MTLDDLAKGIGEISDEKLLQDLAKCIEEWKGDDRNVEALETMVERFFGTAWIPEKGDHTKAYDLWSLFKNDAIKGVGGLTMNERLYAFDLFERFDFCKSEAERLVLYGTVHANSSQSHALEQ